jgi:hypothetical protein
MDVSSADHAENNVSRIIPIFQFKKAIHLPAKHPCFMEEEVFPLMDTTKNIPPNGMLLILCHVYAQV